MYECPIITKSEIIELSTLIAQFLLPCTLDLTEHISFSDAPYEQSHQLLDFLKKHAQDIANNASIALAASGMGLAVEQSEISNAIFHSLMTGEEKVYVIQGSPGSGKTLLAISLLLRAFKEGHRCIFAIRNNRLQAILREILNSAFPGLSGIMIYFYNQQAGRGDLRSHPGNVELLICDEAQRMDGDTVDVSPKKASVVVYFLDEIQRLNPPEQGSREHFITASRAIGKAISEQRLSASIRCHGGSSYISWIEQFLENPTPRESMIVSTQPWRDKYTLQSFVEILDLINGLRVYQQQGNKVALVASFTESPGVMDNPSAPNNLRIGFPLTSGFDLYKGKDIRIPWLMNPKEYTRFWLRGFSNNLDMVASIYGTQGFESDYIGLIWGRDLVFRNDSWVLGDPNACYDGIDRLTTGTQPNRRWCPDALTFLRNRYRIFLTRGIKGTLIFCEDDETREALSSLTN